MRLVSEQLFIGIFFVAGYLLIFLEAPGFNS